jgi:hypothetical protein
MCDYSLLGVPNRLAKEGEELIVYSFPTCSKGLTSPAEVVGSPFILAPRANDRESICDRVRLH